MTDNPKPEVDPRYDAAFQRAGSGSAVTAALSGIIELPPVVTSRVSESWALGDERVDEPTDIVDDLFIEDDVPSPTRISIWEISILVIGVVLIVAGAAAYWWGSELFGNMPGDIFIEPRLRQFGMSLGPFAIAIGLASMIGLLFLRAVHSRSGR